MTRPLLRHLRSYWMSLPYTQTFFPPEYPTNSIHPTLGSSKHRPGTNSMSSKPPSKIPSELNMDSNDSNEGLPNNAVAPPTVCTNKHHQAEVSETEGSTED